MPKSAAARQKKYRQDRQTSHKRLDVLLPNEVFNLLHDNAKVAKLTKAEYIAILIGAFDEDAPPAEQPLRTPPPAAPAAPPPAPPAALHSDGLTVKQTIELHLHHSIARSKRVLEAILNEFNHLQGESFKLEDKEPTSLRSWLACLNGAKQKAIIKSYKML